jgi:hypothetical protein
MPCGKRHNLERKLGLPVQYQKSFAYPQSVKSVKSVKMCDAFDAFDAPPEFTDSVTTKDL